MLWKKKLVVKKFISAYVACHQSQILIVRLICSKSLTFFLYIHLLMPIHICMANMLAWHSSHSITSSDQLWVFENICPIRKQQNNTNFKCSNRFPHFWSIHLRLKDSINDLRERSAILTKINIKQSSCVLFGTWQRSSGILWYVVYMCIDLRKLTIEMIMKLISYQRQWLYRRRFLIGIICWRSDIANYPKVYAICNGCKHGIH